MFFLWFWLHLIVWKMVWSETLELNFSVFMSLHKKKRHFPTSSCFDNSSRHWWRAAHVTLESSLVSLAFRRRGAASASKKNYVYILKKWLVIIFINYIFLWLIHCLLDNIKCKNKGKIAHRFSRIQTHLFNWLILFHFQMYLNTVLTALVQDKVLDTNLNSPHSSPWIEMLTLHSPISFGKCWLPAREQNRSTYSVGTSLINWSLTTWMFFFIYMIHT